MINSNSGESKDLYNEFLFVSDSLLLLEGIVCPLCSKKPEIIITDDQHKKYGITILLGRCSTHNSIYTKYYELDDANFGFVNYIRSLPEGVRPVIIESKVFNKEMLVNELVDRIKILINEGLITGHFNEDILEFSESEKSVIQCIYCNTKLRDEKNQFKRYGKECRHRAYQHPKGLFDHYKKYLRYSIKPSKEEDLEQVMGKLIDNQIIRKNKPRYNIVIEIDDFFEKISFN